MLSVSSLYLMISRVNKNDLVNVNYIFLSNLICRCACVFVFVFDGPVTSYSIQYAIGYARKGSRCEEHHRWLCQQRDGGRGHKAALFL